MELIDKLHNAGIGAIMDFVPVHFAVDAYGLKEFDGTAVSGTAKFDAQVVESAKDFDGFRLTTAKPELLVNVTDCTECTHVCTLRASVTFHRIGLCDAWIGL